jgi:hypothetical protein
MRKLLSGRTTEEDTDNPDRDSTTSTPLWVKMFGIIGIVLVLLVVIMMFFGGGDHGPSRHIKSDDASGQTPPIEHGAQRL